MQVIEVAAKKIGANYPVFIVAEAGVNHNGNVEMAKQLVDAAAEAGVNAIKFQTFNANLLVSRTAPKAKYQLQTTNPSESQFEMLSQLQLAHEAHYELQERCQKLGLLFLSTSFDEKSADFLDKLNVPLFKIGSGEVTNWPFLEHVARKSKPILLSTGMSDLNEVEGAVRVIQNAGCHQLALLHCVSNYPANSADANLRAIPAMAKLFDIPVGFSDHTPGLSIALAAVAIGACIIEKHLTLDKNLSGPDHRSSLEPQELRKLVSEIRNVEQALGNGVKAPVKAELENRQTIRRSLAANSDIQTGTVLTKNMLISLRPAAGIPPNVIHQVLGRKVKRSLSQGELIHWSDLE